MTIVKIGKLKKLDYQEVTAEMKILKSGVALEMLHSGQIAWPRQFQKNWIYLLITINERNDTQ